MSSWFGSGKTFKYKVVDELGERTLVVPPEEPAHSGDPGRIVLDIEARTRTRLKDGGNPCKFIRAWHHFSERRDPASPVTFAEFCRKRHKEWVDQVNPPGALATEEEWITTAVAETRFSVSGRHLRRLRREGKLTARRGADAPRNAAYLWSNDALKRRFPGK